MMHDFQNLFSVCPTFSKTNVCNFYNEEKEHRCLGVLVKGCLTVPFLCYLLLPELGGNGFAVR